MQVVDHITGRTLERNAGSTAQDVVDGVVAELGLPRRSESGVAVTYRLMSDGVALAPGDIVTGDTVLESEAGKDIYERVVATLGDIEAAIADEQPAIHLSTRLAVARRTGAVPERVAAVEQEFRRHAFVAPNVAAITKKRRWVPVLGIAALVAGFAWLFWITEPDAPNVVVAQEREDAEATPIEPPIEVEGRIDVANEVDLYVLEAAEGDFMTVSMVSLGDPEFQHFDAELSVDGPDGRQVAYNDDFAGLNSQVSFEIPTSGEYLIRARALGGCCVGDYVLVVDLAE